MRLFLLSLLFLCSCITLRETEECDYVPMDNLGITQDMSFIFQKARINIEQLTYYQFASVLETTVYNKGEAKKIIGSFFYNGSLLCKTKEDNKLMVQWAHLVYKKGKTTFMPHMFVFYEGFLMDQLQQVKDIDPQTWILIKNARPHIIKWLGGETPHMPDHLASVEAWMYRRIQAGHMSRSELMYWTERVNITIQKVHDGRGIE